MRKSLKHVVFTAAWAGLVYFAFAENSAGARSVLFALIWFTLVLLLLMAASRKAVDALVDKEPMQPPAWHRTLARASYGCTWVVLAWHAHFVMLAAYTLSWLLAEGINEAVRAKREAAAAARSP